MTPAQTVSMLDTSMAPTNTTAIGPCGVSNRLTRRSLRANRFGTWRTVPGDTLNRRPGTWMVRSKVPLVGMWTR